MGSRNGKPSIDGNGVGPLRKVHDRAVRTFNDYAPTYILDSLWPHLATRPKNCLGGARPHLHFPALSPQEWDRLRWCALGITLHLKP